MRGASIVYGLSMMACLLITEKTRSQTFNCASVKNGVFHNYPKNSNENVVATRNGDVQTEVSHVSGDSINYTIKWLDACSYTMQYRSSGKLKPAMLQLLKGNEFIVEITSVTAQYYTYKAWINSKKNNLFESDTLWMQPKAAIPDNRVFSQTTPIDLKRSHFGDTSQYAVLYVFRTGKMACMSVDYVLEANGLPMFLSKNNSAAVFKIYKTGPLQFWAKVGTKEDKFSFNVEPGKTYYLAAYIKWSLPYCTPDIYLLPDDKGKAQKAEAGF